MDSQFPIVVRSMLILAGSIVVLLGIAWFSLITIGNVKNRVARAPDINSHVAARIYLSYKSRTGGVGDLETYQRFSVLPTPQSSLDTLKEKLRVSPQILMIVDRLTDEGSRAAGYAIVYPLNKRACVRITRGALKSGLGIEVGDLCQNPRNASGFYIGGLGASGADIDQTATLVYFANHLSQLIDQAPAARYLFAKPASNPGSYWMKKVGFVPIDLKNTEIWHLGDTPIRQIFHRN